MRLLVRTVVVLLALAAMLGVVAVLGERFVRDEVEAVVTEAVAQQLRQATDDGAGFGTVDAELEGYALVGLFTGSFDVVDVRARDGVVEGVPVDDLQVRASGVSSDGQTVQGLDVTVRADAARAVAAQLDPALVEAVVDSAVAVPPDRVRVSAPFAVPPLGDLPVEVQLQVRAADGGLVVEPVRADVLGLDLDLAQLDLTGRDLVPSYGIAASDLPAGLLVDSVRVLDEAGAAVVVVDLSCTSGCSLTG